jgi:hypothetical protein
MEVDATDFPPNVRDPYCCASTTHTSASDASHPLRNAHPLAHLRTQSYEGGACCAAV